MGVRMQLADKLTVTMALCNFVKELHTDPVSLRAHTRPPGPGALAGWWHGALYSALYRGYRGAGAELASFASHTRCSGIHRVRSCGVTESRTFPCGRGGSGRSSSVVGNGANRSERRAEIDSEERTARRGETSGNERINLVSCASHTYRSP